MSSKKSTRSGQPSSQLIVEQPDKVLMARNRRLKQTTVCDIVASVPKAIEQVAVSSNDVQEKRLSRQTLAVVHSSNTSTVNVQNTQTDDKIELLIKKMSSLEKTVIKLNNAVTVMRVKNNTPTSAQTLEMPAADIVPAKVFSLAPVRLKEILYENRDNEDVNEKLALEDFGEVKTERRDLMNLWIRNIFNVYLYDTKLANFRDKAVNESRVFQVIDKLADTLFTCLDKMDINRTSYEVIRANFRIKVSFLIYVNTTFLKFTYYLFIYSIPTTKPISKRCWRGRLGGKLLPLPLQLLVVRLLFQSLVLMIMMIYYMMNLTRKKSGDIEEREPVVLL